MEIGDVKLFEFEPEYRYILPVVAVIALLIGVGVAVVFAMRASGAS